MSVECFMEECDRSFSTKTGRTRHFISHKGYKEKSIELISELDEKPNYDEVSKRVGLSASFYENHFGSWNNALEKSKFEVELRRNISDEELLEYLKSVSDDDNRVRYRWMNEKGDFSSKLYEKRFGSWEEALESAGLELYDRSGCNNPSWEDAKTTTECDWCGEGIEHYQSVERRFCSYDCKSKNTSESRTGRDNPSWKEGTTNLPYGKKFKQNRRKVLENDNGCVVCGDSSDDVGSKNIHVHHIKPRRKFLLDGEILPEANKINNLVTLCSTHHRKYEGKLTDLCREEFIEEVTLSDSYS